MAQRLPFTKMHGAGNDFVLLDARAGKLVPDAAQLRAMADRHRGVGCDQILLVTDTRQADCLAGYRIFNADGSASEQCGNGARCIAAWLHRDGALPLASRVRLDSPAGPIGAEVLAPLDVRIDMGQPDFSPQASGFAADDSGPEHVFDVDGRKVHAHVVSMGNPHAVVEVASLDDPELTELGPAITRHPQFAAGCNAGFVQVLDAQHVRLRVHERGAGWTLACGSGACAAAVAMIAGGRCQSPLTITLPGGTLAIEWSGPGDTVRMRGPAAFVFEGEWPLS